MVGVQGARHIYREFFFPWLAKHEPHINQKLQEARAKSGDLILFYVKNFTEKGQSLAFDALQYVIRRASGAPHSQVSPFLLQKSSQRFFDSPLNSFFLVCSRSCPEKMRPLRHLWRIRDGEHEAEREARRWNGF